MIKKYRFGASCIHDNVQIENNNVYADILLLDSCRYMWKGKYDNWRIILDNDNKALNQIMQRYFKVCLGIFIKY